MGGRRQRFFNCLAARVLVLKKHLTITGKMKAVKQVNMQRAVQKSTFYKMETQSNTEVFRITALDTSLLSCFPYSVFKQIGTSLVSTSTVFFDFSVLDKFSRIVNCFLHLIRREIWLGKLQLHSFLVYSLFKRGSNTLSTVPSLNTLLELSYLHIRGKKQLTLFGTLQHTEELWLDTVRQTSSKLYYLLS